MEFDKDPTPGKKKKSKQAALNQSKSFDRDSSQSASVKKKNQTIEEYISQQFGQQFYDLVFKLS